MKRRKFMKNALISGFAVALVPSLVFSKGANMQWDKIFPKSDEVELSKVKFKNRFGVELVGDLYTPKNLKGKASAIAIAGPFGAVKEQASGLYAQNLAKMGFITLAFDPSFTGESG